MTEMRITPRVWQRIWRSVRPLTLVAGLAALALVVSMSVPQPSYALDYPSWQDVQNAKANEAAKAAQVQRIQGLINALEAEVAATQAEAEAKGAEYQIAQEKFDKADIQYQTLTAQAEESKKKAEDAKILAGRLAAQLYRTGGNDLSISLLMQSQGSSTEKLLSRLGNMSKLAERTNAIYAEAKTAQQEAESLAKQAEIARVAREELRVQAEQAMQAAIAANEAAMAKLAESQEQSIVLEAQLAALKDTTAQTVAGYEAGVAERKRLEEEARRQAAAAAAAAAAARGVSISDAGWTHPAPAGYVSSNFGWRSFGGGDYHLGTDIAARCGTGIYAATSGRVTYSGWLGSYGNLVMLDHGGGVSTRYAHIENGGLMVNVGDWITVGQQVARMGTTGNSTGCHLHFEVRVNGSAVDPRPYLAARGAGF